MDAIIMQSNRAGVGTSRLGSGTDLTRRELKRIPGKGDWAQEPMAFIFSPCPLAHHLVPCSFFFGGLFLFGTSFTHRYAARGVLFSHLVSAHRPRRLEQSRTSAARPVVGQGGCQTRLGHLVADVPATHRLVFLTLQEWGHLEERHTYSYPLCGHSFSTSQVLYLLPQPRPHRNNIVQTGSGVPGQRENTPSTQ